MSCSHHPSPELLAEYAWGACENAVALVVATHLALCPPCRREALRLEEVGGALLAETEPAELDPKTGEALLARLDEVEPEAAPPPPTSGAAPRLPEPLRSLAGGDPEQLPWRKPLWGLLGVREVSLPLASNGRPARLVELPAGLTIPRHGHSGEEYTLVLEGALSDDLGVYHRGDLSCQDPRTNHVQSVIPGSPCLCLVVNSGRLVARTPLGWLLARVTGE